MDRLDETDERILAELAEHARATFAEIGERVNLSAPAVKRNFMICQAIRTKRQICSVAARLRLHCKLQ